MATIHYRLFPMVRYCCLAFACLCSLSYVVRAPIAHAQDQASSDLVGPWVGWLETPAQHLRLLIQIDSSLQSQSDSAVSEIKGTITSLDQTPSPVPFEKCTLSSDGGFEFTVSPGGNRNLSYSFRGKRNGSRIEGEFENANTKLPLSFLKANGVPDEGVERLGAPSAWRGELDLSVQKIKVQFRVYDQPPFAEPNSPRILFDSLSEKVFGFPVRLAKGDSGQVVMSIPSLPGNAKLQVNTEGLGETIQGKFIQSLLPLTLQLKRVDELSNHPLENDALIAVLKRKLGEEAEAVSATTPPPTPDPSAVPSSDSLADGIREEEFSIDRVDYRQPKVKQDGRWTQPKFRIRGTITWPAGATPESSIPAVVMIAGSGPQDRDETIGVHKPFRVLAQWLAKQGIASLRYDDRGIGSSTGDFLNSTTLDFANDATAVWEHARTLAGIDRLRVGLLGHSEGGMIGPMVAANRPEVAFLILLAPPAFSGSEILATQIDRISELQGVDSKTRDASIALQRKLQSLALDPESDEDKTANKVRQAVLEQWEGLRGMSEQVKGESEEARRQRVVEQILAQFKGLQTPWMRYFLAFDPTAAWLVMRSPTLAMWGDKDVQVLANANRERLLDVTTRNSKLQGDLVVLPGLNHLMQRAETGLPDEYDRISDTIDPSALDVIREWLQQRNFTP